MNRIILDLLNGACFQPWIAWMLRNQRFGVLYRFFTLYLVDILGTISLVTPWRVLHSASRLSGVVDHHVKASNQCVWMTGCVSVHAKHCMMIYVHPGESFFLLVESLQTRLLQDEGEHASTSFCPLLHHFNVLRNAETNCNVFATCAKQCQWGGYRAQWNGKIGLVVTDLLPSILNPRAVSPYHVERDNEETTGTIFCENTSSKSSKSGDSFLMISDSFYTLSYHIISYHVISYHIISYHIRYHFPQCPSRYSRQWSFFHRPYASSFWWDLPSELFLLNWLLALPAA